MGTFLNDLRHSARTLARNRGFALVAVLAVALGVGANTAIFSVVNAVLLRPLPYADADRLMMANLSVPDLRDVEEGSQVFDGIAVYASNLYTVRGEDSSEQIRGAIVSSNFFPLLGRPLIGRTLGEEDRFERTAVLDYAYWQKAYGGDAGALGRVIVLGNKPHTIVGVMPPEFQFPNSQFKVWVPFDSAMADSPEQAANRSLRIFRAVAHLRPGVTPEQAQADLDRVSKDLESRYPDSNAGVRIAFEPVYERLLGDISTPLFVLLGAVALILLVACANVANLLLARATTRERELAVRQALGASRGRLARQLLTESLLLAVLGGGAGLLLAVWGLEMLHKLGVEEIPRASSISVDGRVLLFTLGASLLTGIAFGLAPVLQTARLNLNEALKDGGRGSSRGGRLRGAIVVTEVALSVVVLVGAGLLIRSFAELRGVDTGFEAANLYSASVVLVDEKDPGRRADLAAALAERVRAIPGVQSAGGGTGMPPVTAQRMTNFEAADVTDLNPDDRAAYFMAVTSDYFRALGAPVVAGREFDDSDRADGEKVVVISQGLARTLYGSDDATGRRIRLVNPEQSPEWRTVVGVVKDVRYAGLDDPGRAAIYTPVAQTPFPWTCLMIRTQGQTAGIPQAVQKAVASVDPRLTAARVVPMEQLVSEAVAQPRFNTILLSIFASLALVLAAVGIYGVISYTVAQNTREIGIRMALGARRSHVLRQVVGRGVGLAAVGIALGAAGAYALSQYLTSLLFEVSPTDPATFAAAAALFVGVAVAASLVPALRAMRVDPMVALRHD